MLSLFLFAIICGRGHLLGIDETAHLFTTLRDRGVEVWMRTKMREKGRIAAPCGPRHHHAHEELF